MDDMRFADIMQRERERLNREREEILNQQKDLENKLTEINHEFAAIDAYEAAKTGKVATPRRQQPSSQKELVRRSSNYRWILVLARRPERGGKPYCKLSRKIRAVSVEAKFSSA